jgi:hypothetical protein
MLDFIIALLMLIGLISLIGKAYEAAGEYDAEQSKRRKR